MEDVGAKDLFILIYATLHYVMEASAENNVRLIVIRTNL